MPETCTSNPTEKVLLDQPTDRKHLSPHRGTAFFIEGGGRIFLCVHGSKLAIGEVMFLDAVAWVKRRGRGGKENFSYR